MRFISTGRSMPASPTSIESARRLALSPEQARVLDRYHTRFVRAGAALESAAQDRLAAINERLASLGTQFGQNVLADEKSYALVLEEGDLAGLPEFARANARAAARRTRPCRANMSSPSAAPRAETFLQFSAAAICARSCSRPGSNAARMAGRPTTGRSSPRWSACAPSGPSSWALRPSPTIGSTTRWPRPRPTPAQAP